MVSNELLNEFKQRMHIYHEGEDDNLKQLLGFSINYIESKIGEFDIEGNPSAKELVIERSRYAYNDAVEYFEDNFLSNILSLTISGDDDVGE